MGLDCRRTYNQWSFGQQEIRESDQQKLCDVFRLSSAKLKGKVKTETQWFTVSKHIRQLNLDPPTVSYLADWTVLLRTPYKIYNK